MATETHDLTARQRFFRGSADAIGRTRLGRRILLALSRNTTLQRLTIGGPNPIHLWEEDEEFKAVAADARRLTLLTDEALFTLHQVAGQMGGVKGDVAEVGVYRGGTGYLLGALFDGDDRDVLLFDTFEGMPESADDDRDLHRAGDFADTSLEAVGRAVAGWKRVSLVQGFFPETAGPYADRRFALAHVDVDIYRSVLDCCEFFYPRLTTGAAMVFDDYGQRSCPGARQAVDEFFGNVSEQPFYLPTGQCVVWKLP